MKFLFVVACLSLPALAACGSGGATLTRAQFDAKLSRLCLLSGDELHELHIDDTVGDYKHYASSIVHIDASFAARRAALKPPASIAPVVAAYIDANAKTDLR